MSDDNQEPNSNSLESMVREMFRYHQEHKKYWKIAKFAILFYGLLFILTFGLFIVTVCIDNY